MYSIVVLALLEVFNYDVIIDSRDFFNLWYVCLQISQGTSLRGFFI